MGKYEKGSFTVEAAAVAPMTLFVVLFLLSLLFYVHDFAWYTAAAWESVIGGCGECSDSSVDITEEILRRARKRETQYWTEQPLSMELNAGKTKVKAEYRGTVPFFGGLSAQEYRVQAAQKRVLPVRFIRRYRAAKTIAEREE